MTFKLIGPVRSITPDRAQRMIKIMDAMRNETMTILEVCDCGVLSKSGARKYIRDLVQNEIIVSVGFAKGRTKMLVGRPIYALTSDQERLKWFSAAITAPDKDGFPRTRGKKLAPEGIHVMADDEVFKVKRATWKIPSHTDLLAAFFGIKTVGAA